MGGMPGSSIRGSRGSCQPHTLGSLDLYNMKDVIPPGTQMDVVYAVKCKTCKDEYAGRQ